MIYIVQVFGKKYLVPNVLHHIYSGKEVIDRTIYWLKKIKPNAAKPFLLTNERINYDKIKSFLKDNEDLILAQIKNKKVNVDDLAKKYYGNDEWRRSYVNTFRDLLLFISGERIEYLTDKMISKQSASNIFIKENATKRKKTFGILTHDFREELFEEIVLQIGFTVKLSKNSLVRFFNIEDLEFGK